MARVEFSEWTDDDYLRQAAFKGMDIGKDPRKVVRETAISADDAVEEAEAQGRRRPARRRKPAARSDPFLEDPDDRADPPQAATPDEMAALEAMTKDGVWEIGGHDVSLSNLDKVLFPEPGFTKRDLIRYYVTISPILLPHLKDRPLNLSRWPDGVTGHTFWQKQIPSTRPSGSRAGTIPRPARRESHTYFVADRVATMAWLANHATIDLHPWTSTTDDYRSPTYALIDIDPGTKTTWDEVLTLARLYRAALEHLKVKAWPKVTGKRGIQVWVPVKQIYTYRETSAWVEAVSRADRRGGARTSSAGSGQSRRAAARRGSTSRRTR